MARRRWLLALAVVCELAFLRFAWRWSRPAPGQWALAFFGVCGERPALIEGAGVSDANPPLDVDRDGRVGLAPGQSMTLPLPPGARYLVDGESGALAPYVVLLAGAAACETEAWLPTSEGWARWNPAAPWKEDDARLRELARACGGAALRVERDGDRLTFAWGSCSAQRAVGPEARLAVLAGPSSVRVARAGGWTLQRALNPVALGVSTLIGAAHALLAAAAFGAAGISAVAVLAALRVALPTALLPALLGWALLALVAALTLAWRKSARLRSTPSRRAAIAIGLALAAAAALAPLAAVPSLVRAAVGGPPRIDRASGRASGRTGAPARCLLTGYSTAAGDDLVPGAADAFRLLDSTCAPCRGASARHALPGRIFDDAKPVIARAELAPGATVIFWGGGNDDLFWPMMSRHNLAGSIALAGYALEALLRAADSGARAHPTAAELRPALERLAERSVSTAGAQSEAVRAAFSSAHARGLRLLYAHDFFAWDLAGPRSAARARLLDARKTAVQSGGGLFLDLAEELAPEAGVAWFDDFIHPSAWGHARFAARICQAIERIQ